MAADGAVLKTFRWNLVFIVGQKDIFDKYERKVIFYISKSHVDRILFWTEALAEERGI